jgi:TusA-related sulfurtransferase
MVMDMNSGEMLTVMTSQKNYVKMNVTKATEAAANNNDFAKQHFVATGETAKVDGYDTEIYTLETPQSNGKYWVAKDYPNYTQIKDDLKKLNEGFMLQAISGKIPDVRELPGIPIKIEIKVFKPLALTINATLISINQDPLDASLFVVPADYQQLQVPN